MGLEIAALALGARSGLFCRLGIPILRTSSSALHTTVLGGGPNGFVDIESSCC